MLFNSFIFLIFLVLVVPVYYLLPHRYRNIFLLACSYFFYGYWDWRFLSLILISTGVDYCAGWIIHNSPSQKRRKTFLIVSLCSNLGLLGFFKYFNFFTGSFNGIIAFFGFEPLDYLHLNIILPIGISFYTFQTLSYTIDIYRKKMEPTRNIIDFALFVTFFPQLVAGPIERAIHLIPQIQDKINFSKEKFREGLILITTGMFKKVMIGDTCGRIVDRIFAQPQLYTSLELFMAVILFTVQIYNDFSGYSHIARGTAKLLGYDLIINFRQPYLARSIAEFWRRWHISLSAWVRDYIYIPLGGNKKGKVRTYINSVITMMLMGLWHGASWTFVFYGGLHGTYLCVNRYILKDSKLARKFFYTGDNPYAKKLILLAKIVFINIIIFFTRIFFRSDTFDKAFYFIKNLVNWSPGGDTSHIWSIIITYVLVTLIIDLLEYFTNDHAFLLRVPAPARYAIVTACWIVTLIYLYGAEPMPFVYFQF
ncbi:MAG: MBOAT family protein [bacterium]|nr:MBOAT family protein [bacterium]